MSIYRPPGYGPAPTVEEHLAAPQCVLGTSSWLFRPWANAYPYVVRLHVRDGARVLEVDDPKYRGVRPNMIGGEWCLLDIATGLPCPIGTPPETERERLERAFVEARRNYLAAVRVGHPCRIEHCDFYLAAYTLADHIIKEQTR